MEESQNLSEILFKPEFQYPETSTISNSGISIEGVPEIDDPSLGFSSKFYRPVLKFEWVLSGGSALDIDEALARICVSTAPRSRPELYDTVKDYGAGHWNFEFNTIAQERVNKAKECEEKGNMIRASHHYRLASRYFAIAAYPYLKSDTLAGSSDVLCRQTYKKMYEIDSSIGILQEHTFKVDGKNVTGYLHLPDLKKVYPCVIVVCPYESSITSSFRYINTNLRERGIAAFVLEMPGTGACEKLNMSDHFSMAIEEAITYLSKLPCIDATNIGLYGSGVSATACMRAAIIKGSQVRAMALYSPCVHSFYKNKDILNSLPLCLRSSLCNRLNLDASDWDNLLPRLRTFSLKEQGLLSMSGGCKVPTYVGTVKDSITTEEDISLLNNSFSDITLVEQNHEISRAQFVLSSITESADFFTEKFGLK